MTSPRHTYTSLSYPVVRPTHRRCRTLPLSHRADRIVMVPRVGSSDDFLRLVGCADVMLHPFPFGGSKTAADSVTMAVPVVTLRAPFLRGRMAHS